MVQQSLSSFSQEIKLEYKHEKNHDHGAEVILKKVYGDIPEDVEDNAYLSIIREKKKTAHNIALYPCKYIPELPRWAIKKYSKENDTILDPFIGGGTTFIEALKLKRNCLGIDYNPYARLVSKVKSTQLNKDVFQSTFKTLMDDILNDNLPITKPNFKGVEFWFNENVISGLSKIKKHIMLLNNEDLKNFFLVAFSMTVRKTSYIAPGQILTARRKDWREIKQYTEKETIEMFDSFAREYSDYMFSFSKDINGNNSTRLIGNDARELNIPQDIKEVDLIVASPPYINAMDYIWANRLRIHWLDLVKDDEDRLNLYNFEIGTERIQKKVYSQVGSFGIKEIDDTIKDIFDSSNSNQQSQLRSRVTYQYFLDMKKHFEEAYKVLKKGGRYCIVVGDNTIRKVPVPTSIYLSMIAESVGFKKEKQFQIILKNRSLNVKRNVDFAGKIKYDRMIVLRKD